MTTSRVLRNSVTGSNEDGWDFLCPVTAPEGQPRPCGDRETGEGYKSTGWPTREVAEERGQQHFDEHLGKGVSEELHDFRQRLGLTTVSEDGKRAHFSEEDLKDALGEDN